MPQTAEPTDERCSETKLPLESAVDTLVVSLLRHGQPNWPFARNDAHADVFLNFARDHRLSPLLHHALNSFAQPPDWPARIQDRLAEAAKAETAFQLLRDAYMNRLLLACKAKQIEPIFFKGYALAHTVYPHPTNRPSVDIDLIVPPSELDAIVRLLNSQGFEVFAPYRGKMHSNEVVCRRSLNELCIEFDCHLAINNRPLLARLLSYDEIRASAFAVSPKNGTSDRLVPCLEHSLLLACIHRVAHNNTDDLLWLSDFAYIASAMSSQQKANFLALCRRKAVLGICESSIRAAGTTLQHEALLRLADRFDTGTDSIEPTSIEPTSIYLRKTRSTMGDAFVRWNSLTNATAKAAYLAELLFPNRSFLEWKYGENCRFRLLKNAKDLVALLARSICPNRKRHPGVSSTHRQGPN